VVVLAESGLERQGSQWVSLREDQWGVPGAPSEHHKPRQKQSSCSLGGERGLWVGEAASGGDRVSHHARVKSHSSSREKKSRPPTLSSLWSGCLGKSPFRTRSS